MLRGEQRAESRGPSIVLRISYKNTGKGTSALGMSKEDEMESI